MDLHKKIIQNILEPVYYKAKNWEARKQFHQYLKSRETHSIEENREIQKDKLFELIDYSVKNVPYYRDLARKNQIIYKRETIFEDLKQFPYLTKDIIRSEYENLKSTAETAGRYKNTSGGSTGTPVTLIQDKKYLMENITVYFDHFMGYEPGDRLVRLWGSERDIIKGAMTLRARLLNRFYYRTVFLNSFRMTENGMRKAVERMNRFKPGYMVAYVQSAYELAKFIENNGLSIHPMKGILVSAGTLYDDFREKIETVFGCGVFNRYGSREVGNMAMECEKHEGMHLNLFAHYLEILDDQGEPVKEDECGAVIVTLLTNYSMPLIRFQIGDMAVPTEHTCSCGRGLPLIKSVRGRSVNLFKTRKGDLIDGEYFTHLFYFLDFIQKFQVVQEDFERVVVKLEMKGSEDLAHYGERLDDITKKIRLAMGDECTVEYQMVDEILPTASGKYVYTVSNL